MSVGKRARSFLWLALGLSVAGAIGTGRFLLVPIELRDGRIEMVWHTAPYVLLALVLLILLFGRTDDGAGTKNKYDDRKD